MSGFLIRQSPLTGLPRQTPFQLAFDFIPNPTGLAVGPHCRGRHPDLCPDPDPGPDLGLGPYFDPGHIDRSQCRPDYPHGYLPDTPTDSHWLPT